jgi:asparagine synthase (glutamine-hydrolysing)
MCGIAGIIGMPGAVEIVTNMIALQRHRGPDGARVIALRADAALGHARLSIVDLSERGTQPMHSASGRWTLVFNGELFNYQELARELPDVAWQSESDTEVFLEAVAAWGVEKTLARAVGMFAAALWDRQEHALTLVRDRIGEKPLVYFWDGRVLGFASELKALRPLHASRIQAAALDVYLALGSIPAPLAIFENTHKLPAGHLLRWKQGSLSTQRWWFPECAEVPGTRGDAQKIEELLALVADSVRLRLRADVPVALALSGGIDSSVIAAEMARQGARVEAFTVTFAEDRTDFGFARQVAERCGLAHEEIPAEGLSAERGLDAMVAQYDEPFADSAAVSALALARALDGRYKVILNGDGGDEAFGGYRHYEFIAVKQAAAAAAGLRDGHRSSTVYVQAKTAFRAQERARLTGSAGNPGDGPLDRLLQADAFLGAPRRGALQRALWCDRHLYLANGLTYKTDMALAAHGMEGRAPLLDHRILEWTQNLDDRDLVRGRDTKVLLRRAYAPELPPAVGNRSKKGFGAPVGAWLAGPFREQVRETLPCALLDPDAQSAVLTHGNAQRVWTLFLFARWARHWGATW